MAIAFVILVESVVLVSVVLVVECTLGVSTEGKDAIQRQNAGEVSVG